MRHNSSFHYHFAHDYPAYPNQANSNYYLQRLRNAVARLAAGVGLTVSIVFLTRMM